jgi:hypothetical protein
MTFRERLKIVGYALAALFGMGAVMTIVKGPSATRQETWNSLTPEQRLEIFDDCNQHPKALRCQ